MKRLILLALLMPAIGAVFAQSEQKLQWQVTVQKVSDSTYDIKATTQIPQGWHLYADNTAIEGLDGVIINYDIENATNEGKASTLEKPVQIDDPVFGQKSQVFKGELTVNQRLTIRGFIPAELKGIIGANIANDEEFLPEEFHFSAPLEGGHAAAVAATRIKVPTIDVKNPQTNCGIVEKSGDSGLLSVFFLGMLGGLIALLTPCVFPMIPVTVSYFTKKSGNRKLAIKNGILYGFFIFLIYVLASLPFHVLGNVQPEIFNNISTNVWLNIIFFVIFIVFALSFFGFFEITLPSSIAGKADSKSSLGSIGGIFFMALTLAIVSFSCTGPILGSLLVGSLSEGAVPLTAGLAGFGVALALPFALFAIFPHWLQSLPKSGGWLDTVKKILAFLELALAFKFLSNADLVMHWGILKREVFIGIWILISAALTLYLFGIIRLPHDYKGMKISAGRKVLGGIALLFTIYLIPAIIPSKSGSIQLLSGFPPPMTYSIYGADNIKGKGLEADVVNDYEKALQLSKEQKKPILIDFTGWACVNCRKMEENVWTQPDVAAYIKEHFILVSLYVDDREKLPVEERFTYGASDKQKKDIVTIGDKWSTFQTENFIQATQPLYAIIDRNEMIINKPVGYTPNAAEYLQWLKCGYESFVRN